uniref:Selenoprotein T n=2 Tax=Timema TaxID=61471 RepID=A0A7R8VFD0_TIMDO|nr:unnamed protein product [Timema douglasi]
MADNFKYYCFGFFILFFVLSARELFVHSESNNVKEIPSTKVGSGLFLGPTLKFRYCYSCGYQKAFQEYYTILQQKYPEIIVEGENYNPSGLSMIIAKALGVIKVALIVCILSGINILQYTGIPLQSCWSWCVDNKLYSCMMVFFLSNALEAQLVSTGAFEISFNDMPVWSKLETGRIPQPPELFQIIDNNLQFQTTVELKPGFAK